MASQNQNHQDETAIDKVHSHLTDAGTKIANNTKYIYWAIGAIVVVAAFVLGYLFFFQKPKMEKSFEAYNRVQTTSFGNDSIAAAQYKEVADKFKGETAGKLAALSAAESFYNEGKYAEAAEYLKRFSSKDAVLEANALVLLGDCYVNMNKYDEALDAFQKAIRKCDGNPQIAPRVLLKEANIFDAQKKYDKALECYETIKKDFPQFQLGNGVGIDAYIAREKARLEK